MRETFPCINTPRSAGVCLMALCRLCARLWVLTVAIVTCHMVVAVLVQDCLARPLVHHYFIFEFNRLVCINRYQATF